MIEADPKATAHQAAPGTPQRAEVPGKADDNCYLMEGSGACFYCTGPENGLIRVNGAGRERQKVDGHVVKPVHFLLAAILVTTRAWVAVVSRASRRPARPCQGRRARTRCRRLELLGSEPQKPRARCAEGVG